MKKTRVLLTIAMLTVAAFAMAQQKYAGGDISLLSEYEDHGAVYYDTDGTTQITDLLSYFSDCGHNAMRVRLFHNPDNASEEEQGEGVVQDLEYVTALGKRIKDAGFAFMLDFHYSDTWADPSNQWIPAAWADLSNDDLYDSIYNYTKMVLQTLVAAGATPDFIQIGNEISYGMLWGEENDYTYKYYAGSSSTSVTTRFTTLLSNASKACREVCSDAKIIIHTERVANTSYLKTFYEAMADAEVDYDIIGTSYYSYYHGDLDQLESALTTLEDNFDKDIMVVETGYYHVYQADDVTYDLSDEYPISDEGQCAFTEDLIDVLNEHESVIGLFWWDMEANENGLDWSTQRVTTSWYNAGLFDNETGKAMSAIKVLKNFISSTSSEDNDSTEESTEIGEMYLLGNIDGTWEWDTDLTTLTETEAGSGIYYNENVTFTSGTYFALYSYNYGSWGLSDVDYYEYRYGPSSGGASMVINSKTTIYSNASDGWDRSWYVSSTATYAVTVDMNEMYILFEDEDYEEELPSVLYSIGNDGVWSYTTAVDTFTTTGDGIYTGTLTMEDASGSGYGWFCLVKELASWDAANCYGPESANEELVSGVAGSITNNTSNSWLLDEGEYEVEIDLNEMTITVTDPDAVNCLYMMGNTGNWDCTSSEGTLYETSSGSGIYTGEDIVFSASWFDVFSQLGSWDTAYRYGPAEKDTEITIGTAASLTANTENSFVIQSSDYGTYDVTVDLNEMTILLSSDESDGISNVTLNGDSQSADTNVYNLSGQRVATSLEGLAPGIYIYNGKKVAVTR